MGVWRKWIFPVIRILLVAAIAGALVKLAFFPENAPVEDPAVPTGAITQPEVTVTQGTILNEVSLAGTVANDAPIPVRSTATGTVDEVFVGLNSAVSAGTLLFDVKVETPRDPVVETLPDGSQTMTVQEPAVEFKQVLAPAAGTLSSLTVLPGQAVAVGDTTGQVALASFSVSGILAPAQQYRLTTLPSEALITITGGPAPFTCAGLRITTPLPGANGGDGATPSAPTTTVHCAIPSEIRVFAGLAAQITIAGGTAENVLVVPTTAVTGSADIGTVWFVNAAGEQEERAVTLGMSDGRQVEIVAGLQEGDTVLEFVPGAVPPPMDEGCMQYPDGSMVCGEAG